MGPKTHKADSQFEKLWRKTVVLLACSEPNCPKYDLMAGWGAHRKFGTTSPNSARWHHPLIGLQSTP